MNMAFQNLLCLPVSLNKKKHKDKNKTIAGTGIKVDDDTDKPGMAWERLKEIHVRVNLPVDLYLHQPCPKESLRFVCLSDTHCCIEKSRVEYRKRVPEGDVLIHCGDFSMQGAPSEIIAFDSFIGGLPHPVKLVIAGNHEFTFQENMCVQHTLIRQQLGLPFKATEAEVCTASKQLLQHLLYLEDETIEICGINIYGSPWVPAFGCSAFSARRGERLLDIWNGIPSDTDILVTHGPPCGYGDFTKGDKHAGCVELLNTVVHRVKPKFHVFGHIHSGYGMYTNHTTTFINSAICDNRYKPASDPIVFDYPLPKGFSRKDFQQLTTQSLRAARATRIPEEGGSCGDEDGCVDKADVGRTAVLYDESVSNGHLSADSPFAFEHNGRARLLDDIRAAGKKKALTESIYSQETLAACAELLSKNQSPCKTVTVAAGAENQLLHTTDKGTSAGPDNDRVLDCHSTEVKMQLDGDGRLSIGGGSTVKRDANSLESGPKQTQGGSDVQPTVVEEGLQAGTRKTGIRALIARFERGIKLDREQS